MLQNDTKSLVPITYFDIFSLRLLGMTYSEIAAKTNYSESHIRRLFAKGGAMRQLWEKFEQEVKDSRIEESQSMMFGNLPDVMRTLIATAKGKGQGAIEASKVILAYTLGRPPEKVNSETQEQHPQTLADWIKFETKKEQILNAFSNFGLIKEKDESTVSETPI